MNVLPMLETAASGMSAQRGALDIAARNVAAAEAAGTTGTFERMVPEFQLGDNDGAAVITLSGSHLQRGSDVDMITEMISVMNASRAYEADASMFDVGKRLAERTIDLGRSS